MSDSDSLTIDKWLTLRGHLRTKSLQVSQPSELIEVLDQVTLRCKAIARLVRRARLEDVLGSVGTTNIQGEVQEKLDVISNELLLRGLSHCPPVAACASEEEEEAIVFRSASDGGHLAVLFDPLDGSSNINVAAGVGTIFSVLRNTEKDENTANCVLQPGRRQVAAGYVLYGSSVLLVLTTGEGVDMYVLDPDVGEFWLVKEALRIPEGKKVYSLNEAYYDGFPLGYQRYLDFVHENEYSGRYIGSMVADVHRTLLQGGVFLYPPNANNPVGKLRVLYEANPMGFLIEQAGGKASTGEGRILNVEPTQPHQRTPVILGSSGEVSKVLQHL